MIRKTLIRLAKKYLGLIEMNTALAIENSRDAVLGNNYSLTIDSDKLRVQVARLEASVKAQQQQIVRMKDKYPAVWLGGDVAQGVVQLPNLKIAVEFFREENRLCVFIPWADAEGRNPQEFVPPWLEVDPSMSIEGVMDKMNGSGILYKIPVKGWDDTIELTKKLAEDHPSFQLDSRITEKTKSFRTALGVNGMFCREQLADGSLMCKVMFNESDVSSQGYFELPRGNMEIDPSRSAQNTRGFYGDEPRRIFWWRVAVMEKDVPEIGNNPKQYVTDGGKQSRLLPGKTEGEMNV